MFLAGLALLAIANWRFDHTTQGSRKSSLFPTEDIRIEAPMEHRPAFNDLMDATVSFQFSAMGLRHPLSYTLMPVGPVATTFSSHPSVATSKSIIRPGTAAILRQLSTRRALVTAGLRSNGISEAHRFSLSNPHKLA